jgi:HEAT repeat protein
MTINSDVRKKNEKGLRRTLQHGGLVRRGLAAIGLGVTSSGTGKSDEALLAALKDSNQMIRYAAMISLISRDPCRPPEPVIQALRARPGAPDPFSASEFLKLGLFRLKRMEALPYLRRFAQDRDPTVRGQAAMAMGEIEEPAVVPELVRMLDDESKYVRTSAIESLGAVGDQRAISPLTELAATSRTHRRRIRRAVAEIDRRQQGIGTT